MLAELISQPYKPRISAWTLAFASHASLTRRSGEISAGSMLGHAPAISVALAAFDRHTSRPPQHVPDEGHARFCGKPRSPARVRRRSTTSWTVR